VSASPNSQFWHQNFKIPASHKVSWSRFPTVAICTLAALTAQELTQQAIAFPTQETNPEEVSRLVVPEQIQESIPSQAIASPETSGVHEFSRLSIPPQGETAAGNWSVVEQKVALSPGIQPAQQWIVPEAEVLPVQSAVLRNKRMPTAQQLVEKQAIASLPTEVQSDRPHELKAPENIPIEATMAIAPLQNPTSSPKAIRLAADPAVTVPSQEEIQNLQQQLQNVETTPEFGKTTEGSPSLTIVTPTGFGADNNTGFVSATYENRTRYSDVSDGLVGFGVGLGDARKAVGVELSYTVASFGSNRSFGSGGFNAKVHHQFSEDFAAAVGWNGFLNLGDRNDFEQSVYGVGTKIFRTQADINKPFSRVAVSAGIGNGQFRSEGDVEKDQGAVNVFGSVAVRVARPVSFIAEWTGQDLGLGLSIAPFRNFPLVITPAVRDITGAGDGARFVLGTGFGFKF
jgi:hypothetical protein